MLELVAARQQDRDLVARLEQLYSYDFSAFTGCALSPDWVFPAVKSFQEIWWDRELSPSYSALRPNLPALPSCADWPTKPMTWNSFLF